MCDHCYQQWFKVWKSIIYSKFEIKNQLIIENNEMKWEIVWTGIRRVWISVSMWINSRIQKLSSLLQLFPILQTSLLFWFWNNQTNNWQTNGMKMGNSGKKWKADDVHAVLVLLFLVDFVIHVITNIERFVILI